MSPNPGPIENPGPVESAGPVENSTLSGPTGSPAGAGPVLAIEGLRKSYGEVEVLKGIDVALPPGGFLVLVGPSGCGKSTLLNCIAGLEETTSGTIRIGGRDVTHVPPKDRDIAMVFQSYALYPTMSVGENISFGMRIRGMKRAEYEPRVRAVAEVLRIDHLLDRSPAQLSGGQRQRVAMGRALVRDPKLFLFDEPLSNLDAKLRVEMRAEIKRLHERLRASGDTSIVYVTHDQIEALTLATQIVVLEGGVVQQVGSPDEIYARPANTFVADFMGSPAMNLVPAAVRRDGAGASLVFADGSVPLDAATAARLPAAEVIVGVRPEAIALADANGDASGNGSANGSANGSGGVGSAGVGARVVLVENAGSDAYVTFRIGETPVTARFAGRSGLASGDAVRLALDPAAITFFDPATKLRID